MSDNKINSIAPNLWVVDYPQKFLGMEFGTRMTIIRLKSGDLFLHSPVKLTDNTLKILDSIGKVRYIVSPNKFHHLHVDDYFNSFPDAEIFAAPSLEKKRSDLPFHGTLSKETVYGWQKEIDHLIFGGMPLFNEVEFFHSESNTLILTDLILNFGTSFRFLTKILLQIDGVYNRFAVPRLTRYIAIKDKVKARESVNKILSWDFDRVILAHGNILDVGGRDAVKNAFEWLLLF